jgi:hypothetical protein
MSNDFDRFILQEVFKVLKTPPIDMLKSALKASRSKKQTRLSWIGSERERLRHEQRIAEERADLTRGSLPRVHFDALAKLEKLREEQERFEQKIALEPPALKDESEEELEALCQNRERRTEAMAGSGSDASGEKRNFPLHHRSYFRISDENKN